MFSQWSANVMHLKLWLDIQRRILESLFIGKMPKWIDDVNDPVAMGWRNSFIQRSVADICKRRHLEKNLD